MGITIKELAKLAGCSKSTVSRALSGHPSISEETKGKILSLAERHRYQPNRLARSLITKRTDTIGLILTDIGNPYYIEVMKGIENTASKAGHNIILCNSEDNPLKEEAYLRLLSEKQVDGIIIATFSPDSSHLELLDASGIPYVLLDRLYAGGKAGYVHCDNVEGSSLIVSHLISRGHRRIGLLNGIREMSAPQDRLEGYKKALEKHGIAFDPSLVVNVTPDPSGGYEGMKRLLALLVRPTAVFTLNDMMAIYAIEAAKERAMSVPEDIAIVGYDDIPLAKVFGLTTVHQPMFEMGAKAAAMLIEQVENGPSDFAQSLIFHPSLVIRRTCGNVGTVA